MRRQGEAMSDEQGLMINQEMHLTIDKIKGYSFDKDDQGNFMPAKIGPADRHRTRRLLLWGEQHPEYGFQDVCSDDPEGFEHEIKPCVACDGKLMPEYHIHFITRFLRGKDDTLGPREVWTGIRWTPGDFLSDIVQSDYREYCALIGFKLPL